ncbi:hypothetical protein NDU88_006659 [Pleurodeles waltl]|uniref:Uncharacterized protein n=1 Tax=Pleurodeles waltl TaxID=8319 RepID=A0AAV7LTC5_PLEWA|nr:hypothetical protein NDU88_006659 [Pleurodeles waltl]
MATLTGRRFEVDLARRRGPGCPAACGALCHQTGIGRLIKEVSNHGPPPGPWACVCGALSGVMSAGGAVAGTQWGLRSQAPLPLYWRWQQSHPGPRRQTARGVASVEVRPEEASWYITDLRLRYRAGVRCKSAGALVWQLVLGALGPAKGELWMVGSFFP